MTAADYRPPHWLRNRHVQSILSSSPLRVRRGQHLLENMRALTTEHIVDGGDGVRLQGLHSVVPGSAPRRLALLLHGWEGSVNSSYMRLTTAHLLAKGFNVFRLNFRDHGNTHHLNEALFHSNRIDEVVHAAREVSNRFATQPMVVAGYSLGGNFALRVALRAPGTGLQLAHAAAVCPVLDPAKTMTVMEEGVGFYNWYFARKWRGSLLRKRKLFPQQHDYDDRMLKQGLRDLTRWLAEQHTDFDTLDAYFNGYNIADQRMAGLTVPASILTSEDDPVIPVADFRSWQLPEHVHLEIARWGGHCGFLQNAKLDGFAEWWVADRLSTAVAGASAR
ncbi:MAG: alpha/beta fold hydrolase [Lysobacter sp.]|nr:alpha/beta fold hydrolase [Lysobacter sp.]